MKTLALLLALAPLAACRSKDDVTRFEQSQFIATPPDSEDALAVGRVVVDPIVRGPGGEAPSAVLLRLYLDNPGELPVRLDPDSLRLVDAADQPLETLRVVPTLPAVGFTIRPGRTRRFEATFAFPAGGEAALAGFFLEWRVERGTERASGRTRIVTDWTDPLRE